VTNRAAFALALLSATALAPPVSAQTAQAAAPPPPPAAEQVVVLGSRVKSHTVVNSPVPVDVYTGPELRQALTTGQVGQALQNLSPSINMPHISASGSSDTVRVIQIRGLPPDEVLVLIDGKRRHTNPVPDIEGNYKGTVPVDLNTIPPSAIDHIEVLRDGAGAQYGSDAIAGVVNIVLKKAPTGGSVTVGFGENDTSFAPTGKRIIDGQTGTLAFDDGFELGNGGYFRFGADGLATGGTQRAGRSDAYWTSEFATPADIALNNRILFKSGDPAYQNVNLFYNAMRPFSDGLQAYSFATYNFRHSEGAAFFRYPGDAENDYNTNNIYPNGYRPSTTVDSFDIGFVAGLRQVIADPWTWDLSVRQADSEFHYGVENSLNASLGDARPTHFHLADFIFRQTGVNADATRDVDLSFLPTPLNFATGVEYMHEIYQTGAGDFPSYEQGPITSIDTDFGPSPVPPGAQAGPGLAPQDTVNLSRDIGALYAEGSEDWTPAFTTDLAGRFSDYADSGTAGTGKLAARYNITSHFLLRGSISNSFRAPALAQEGFRFNSLDFNVYGNGLQANELLPATDPLARDFGAIKLKPETSTNFSFGEAWRLPYNTVLTIDAYYIILNHRITRTSDLQSPLVTDYLDSHGYGQFGSVAFLTNATDTTSRGIDFVLQNTQEVGGGELRLSAAANINGIHLDKIRNTSPALSAIDPSLTFLDPGDLLRIVHGTPDSKLILTADWTVNRYNLLFRATRFGSMYTYSYDPTVAPLVDGTPAQYFGPKWVIDLEGTVNITPAWAFTLGTNNLFDVYPTRTYQTNDASYGGALPYDPTDPVGINGAYYYGRLTYKF
jgi:iron complex outermembrane receptor protein